MSTGDGGMITTGNKDWDARFKLLRQHGMSVPDTVRHGSARVLFEAYPLVGYNYRMTDIQAAVGREQLKRLPQIIAGRRAIAEQYRQLLGDVPELELPDEPDWARSNWQSYCVRLPQNCNQRNAMQQILDRGIATRRGIMCSHREAPYLAAEPVHPLPRSEEAQDRSIILPLYVQMSRDDVERVCAAVRDVCIQ
jgi:dTDP-4-amino-4,6-dideoxygalactose transaminase